MESHFWSTRGALSRLSDCRFEDRGPKRASGTRRDRNEAIPGVIQNEEAFRGLVGTARPGANSSLWILLDFLLASLPIVRKTHSAGRQGVDNPLTIHGCNSSGGVRANTRQLWSQHAEGVGLEPTSPSGQRFSSVWPGVLTGPTYFCPRLFVQVSEKTTS